MNNQEQDFWSIAARKSAQSLFIWAPLVALCISIFLSLDANDFDEVKIIFITCLTFSYSVSFFVCLFSLLMWMVVYRAGEHGLIRFKQLLWPHFAYAILALPPGLWLAERALNVMIDRPFSDWAGVREQIAIGVLISVIMIIFFAYIETKRHASELKKDSAVANFNMLRTQMQPHFLFNSLNSLAALIDLDTGMAGIMTQQLADLYRGILDASKSPINPLSLELSIARSYLQVEKTRLGRRLEFTIDAPESLLGQNVPSLMIQTLVENAIKHGISPCLHGGFVTVRASVSNNKLVIEIENSGSVLQKEFKPGTGLSNTKERLATLYGTLGNFELVQIENKTLARLQLPLVDSHENT